ncbi:MAG: flippase [Candidatus Woesearchaeota archaeon]|nr:flippase [Candidatus Woesearchaeota archaeon]
MKKEKNTNYAKKALYGTIAVLLISLISGFIGYLLRLVLARNLTQTDYGMFYATFSLFGLLALFKSLGLNEANAKLIPEYLNKKNYAAIKGIIVSVFSLQFISSTTITIIMFLLSDYLAENYLHSQDASIIIKLFAIMFWLIPFENFFRSSFHGFQKMLYYAGVELLRVLFIFISTSILLRKDLGIFAPSISYVAAYVFISIICIPFFIRMFPQFTKTKALISSSLIKKLIKFGFSVMIGLFGSVVLSYTDTTMISIFKGLEDVALYQVAYPTSTILLYFGSAIAAVLLPLSSELWAKKEKEKLKSGIGLLYKYSFMIVLPAGLLFLSFPEIILNILFGERYINASFVLQILGIGAAFYTIGLLNLNILSGIGKPKENAKVILVAALFNVIANLILIPPLGIMGASITTFCGYAIILMVTSYKVRKYIKVKIPWLNWLKNLVAGVVFLIIIYLLKAWLAANIWVEAIMSVGVASVVYIALLFAFGLITKKDVEFMKYALGFGKAGGIIAE